MVFSWGRPLACKAFAGQRPAPLPERLDAPDFLTQGYLPRCTVTAFYQGRTFPVSATLFAPALTPPPRAGATRGNCLLPSCTPAGYPPPAVALEVVNITPAAPTAGPKRSSRFSTATRPPLWQAAEGRQLVCIVRPQDAGFVGRPGDSRSRESVPCVRWPLGLSLPAVKTSARLRRDARLPGFRL